MKIWPVNYNNLNVSRCTNIVYIGRYLILTYIEKKFLIACSFFEYICWSVNCMNWVTKLNNFFLTCAATEAGFIFNSFKYCPLWKVHFQYSYTFFSFFIWSVNCSRTFSAKELSLWIIEHISEMSRNVNINFYLRPCSIAIYGKLYLYYLYNCILFWFVDCKNLVYKLWSIDCKNLVYELCITFWKCQDRQILFILQFI